MMVRCTTIPTQANSAAHTTAEMTSTRNMVLKFEPAMPLIYGLELSSDHASIPNTAPPKLMRKPTPQMP